MTAPSRLTCEQVFARLDDYVDRELSAEEMAMVREHLDTCAVCAAEHRFEAAFIRGVKERLVRIDVPTGLAVRIAERLRDATKPGNATPPA